MEFTLDDYIDRYIEDVDAYADKEIARHLREIIPRTTHIDKAIFDEITGALKKEMDNGKDFKAAFIQVCEEYVLVGDIINAALPAVLTRIILNETKLMGIIFDNLNIPITRREIRTIVLSKNRGKIQG